MKTRRMSPSSAIRFVRRCKRLATHDLRPTHLPSGRAAVCPSKLRLCTAIACICRLRIRSFTGKQSLHRLEAKPIPQCHQLLEDRRRHHACHSGAIVLKQVSPLLMIVVPYLTLILPLSATFPRTQSRRKHCSSTWELPTSLRCRLLSVLPIYPLSNTTTRTSVPARTRYFWRYRIFVISSTRL